jgi:hypothetical protein
MKKHIQLLGFVSAIFAVLTLQSCDKEDPTPAAPTLTAPTTTTAVQISTPIDVSFSYTAAGGFASSAVTAQGGTATVKTDGTNGASSGTIMVTYTADANEGAGSVMLTVTDAKGQTGNATAVMDKTEVPPPTVTELSGTLTASMTLNKGSLYLIKGPFVVGNGVTLTVAAGAIVKGDKATKGTLIVKQGGTLTAIGTSSDPIIFTSAQPINARDRGDWGGIIIMGDAFVNQTAKPSVEGLTPPATDADFFKYGTVSTSDATVGNNTQNSGTLKYVRIEYAGIELIPNSETNGLTLAGVGNGTTIDYVQSSYGGDDGFEWFGGTVNATHLISFATWDDDFDTDFGWRGKVQWGVAVRAPFVADQSGSTAFESDSQGNGNSIGTICTSPAGGTGAAPATSVASETSGCTQGVFSNMTVLGPRDYTRAISGNYTRAMHIRRRTAISVFNSVVSGWQQGIEMDDQGTLDNYNGGIGVLQNNMIFVPIAPVGPTNNAFAAGNSYYGSNVAGALTPAGPTQTGTVANFVEAPNSGNAMVKGVVATKADGNFAANWAATAVAGDNIINPYTGTGLEAAPFYAGQTTSTYPSNPDFALGAGSLSGLNAGDLFAHAKLQTFFDKTLTYKGAFGATDWTDGWSEFQPLTKAY